MFDSLCQPSTTYTGDNGRGTVNGVKCTQGVTLHLTYHTSSVPASKCNAAGWDETMEDYCTGAAADERTLGPALNRLRGRRLVHQLPRGRLTI